jgi:hypothetical protein
MVARVWFVVPLDVSLDGMCGDAGWRHGGAALRHRIGHEVIEGAGEELTVEVVLKVGQLTLLLPILHRAKCGAKFPKK